MDVLLSPGTTIIWRLPKQRRKLQRLLHAGLHLPEPQSFCVRIPYVEVYHMAHGTGCRIVQGRALRSYSAKYCIQGKAGDCVPLGIPQSHGFSEQDAATLAPQCPHKHLLIIREIEAEVEADESIDLDY